MKLNISPRAITSRIISSLIKKQVNGDEEDEQNEGVDLASLAQKIFAKKQAKIDEEKNDGKESNES